MFTIMHIIHILKHLKCYLLKEKHVYDAGLHSKDETSVEYLFILFLQW